MEIQTTIEDFEAPPKKLNAKNWAKEFGDEYVRALRALPHETYSMIPKLLRAAERHRRKGVEANVLLEAIRAQLASIVRVVERHDAHADEVATRG